MGRRRGSDHHLPPKVYLRSGTYYFVDDNAKWVGIGKSFIDAMAKYAELVGFDKNISKITDLIDRYLVEVAPKKAAAIREI